MQTSATTNEIRISVETSYQLPSHNSRNEEFFAYRITIENLSNRTVQLMRRHWYIIDADGSGREVEGEGVVGQQPILHPNESHQYISGCTFITPIGKMYGTFTMRQLNTPNPETFKVDIPVFLMVVPFKLN